MPSTPCQYFGHGFSGGHHAPMVRTLGGKSPYSRRLAFVPPRERVVTESAASYSYADCGSMNGCSTGNCSTHGLHISSQPQAYQHYGVQQHGIGQPSAEYQPANQGAITPVGATPMFAAPGRQYFTLGLSKVATAAVEKPKATLRPVDSADGACRSDAAPQSRSCSRVRPIEPTADSDLLRLSKRFPRRHRLGRARPSA